jgi:hypothetical protein
VYDLNASLVELDAAGPGSPAKAIVFADEKMTNAYSDLQVIYRMLPGNSVSSP